VQGLASPLVPLLYFGLAQALLLTACAALALDPAAVAGRLPGPGGFLAPWTIGLTHLVTIGWVSASILGSLYAIAPLALKSRMPSGAADGAAFALFAAGCLGVAGGFLGDAPGVAAWSGSLVIAGALFVGWRTWTVIRGARIHGAVKLHVVLAFANLAAGGAMGMLHALPAARAWLPEDPLPRLAAHLHLVAIGWGVMMVAGIGYRMLPMVLPSSTPAGPSLYASAVLLQAGVIGMTGSFLFAGRSSGPASALVIAGLGVFFLHVLWMRARMRRPAAWIARPDPGALQARAALLCGGLAVLCGAALMASPEAAWTPRLRAVYGVLGVVGFLAQIVVGVRTRILPMFAALHVNLARGCEVAPITPADMGSVRARWAVLLLWIAGVPLLAAGMALPSAPLLGVAGWLLLAATAIDGIEAWIIARLAFAKPRGASIREFGRASASG
jgi:hypothetical protein